MLTVLLLSVAVGSYASRSCALRAPGAGRGLLATLDFISRLLLNSNIHLFLSAFVRGLCVAMLPVRR